MPTVPIISQPPAPPSSPSIFHLIHELHAVLTRSIDSALTWDQLNSPPIQYTLVRPFVSKYAARPLDGQTEKQRSVDDSLLGPERRTEGGDKGQGWALGAVLYALMVNRIQFINLAEADLSYSAMQNSRAAFCELLAMKIIRASPHTDDEADLVDALVHGWCAFDGASQEVWDSFGDEREEVAETTGSALELAIVSQSKRFLSLPLIQHLISQIYTGHLIYLPTSHRSLISDSYVSERTKKRRQASHSRPTSPRLGATRLPATFSAFADEGGASAAAGILEGATRQQTIGEVFVYNPYEAGWLHHQRLRVPKWRNWIEFTNFAILLGLFIATLASRDVNAPTVIEVVSVIFTFGFILDEFAASQEHGWTVYAANAWNAFDLAYISIFTLYLALRVFALITHSPTTSDLAFDILAIGACILFPRLVFFLIKDHVVIIALKAMVARFLGFMGLTFLAFSGICFCLWTLGRATWTVKQIIWLMLQIWFGSSYLGFSASESFHPIFGPIILISYAALCNVLLITILIAILSNKFAEINGNAQEEHMFQRVVKTVEGVKSDPIFSYMPPLNLAAFVLLSPLSWVCDARMLHRINVFCVRAANFPILFLISAYERWAYRKSGSLHLKEREELGGAAGSMQRSKMFDSWLGGGSEVLISSVFEVAPPPSALHVETDLTRSAPASTLVPSASSSSDTDSEAEAGGDRDAKNGKAKHKRKHSNGRTRSSGFDSPLARLFGGGAAFGGKGRKTKVESASGPKWKSGKTKSKTRPGPDAGEALSPAEQSDSYGAANGKGNSKPKSASRSSVNVNFTRSPTTDTSDTDTDQVKQLKKELAEVRESQLRMEEMLNRMLNPASSGK